MVLSLNSITNDEINSQVSSEGGTPEHPELSEKHSKPWPKSSITVSKKVSSSNSTVSVAAKKQNGSKELELLTNTGRWFLRHKND
jgi:hypothetical protein